MESIATIFEYYTQSLNPDKTNFVSPKIWDDINDTFTKICKRERSIDYIIEDNYNRIIPQNDISIPVEKLGAYCDYNPKFLNHRVLDVIQISFNKFYPNIILSLYEEGVFPISENFEIFSYIVKNFNKIKEILSDDGYICLRIYVNYYFGKLHRDDKDIVCGRGSQITSHFSQYPGWIYSNVDEIYIKDSLGIEEELKCQLDKFGFPYEIEYFKEALVIGKGKIITINKDSLGKIRGFRTHK